MKKVIKASFYHRHKNPIRLALMLTLTATIILALGSIAAYISVSRQSQQRLQEQLQAAEKRTNNLAAEKAKNIPTTPATASSSNPASPSANIDSTSGAATSNTGNGSSFNLGQTQDGCGTPYETTYSTVRKYDSTKLWNSPDVVTGGSNGKSALCKVNGAMVYKVIVAPIDKVIISGSATSIPTSTPAVTSEPRDRNGLTAAERSALCAKLVSGNAGSSSTYQMYCVNY